MKTAAKSLRSSKGTAKDAVAVSAVPAERSGEVGGLQNTATNLGASIGTALAGSVLIASLTATFLTGLQANPVVSEEVKTQASVQLAAGAPFVSQTQLQELLIDAGVGVTDSQAIVEQNEIARVAALDSALAVLAVLALLSLFATFGIPSRPVGSEPAMSSG